MLRVDNETKRISVNRGDGDSQGFDFSIKGYEFKIGDKIKIGVYEKKGYSKNSVLLKEFEIKEPTEKYRLTFTKEELTIGELIEKYVDYWYEIQLNDNTIIGSDDDGDKIFRLYPEGSDNV